MQGPSGVAALFLNNTSNIDLNSVDTRRISRQRASISAMRNLGSFPDRDVMLGPRFWLMKLQETSASREIGCVKLSTHSSNGELRRYPLPHPARPVLPYSTSPLLSFSMALCPSSDHVPQGLWHSTQQDSTSAELAGCAQKAPCASNACFAHTTPSCRRVGFVSPLSFIVTRLNNISLGGRPIRPLHSFIPTQSPRRSLRQAAWRTVRIWIA